MAINKEMVRVHERKICPMQKIDRFGMVFRRCPGTEFLVTPCGRWIINSYYPHKTTHVGRSKKYPYLRIDGKNIHTLVAKTWVWNPNPTEFKVVDHIDGDSQNNTLTNLRWVNYTLNALNKERLWAYKVVAKRKNGVSIYYKSKVTCRGEISQSNHPTFNAAEIQTKTMINELFFRHYRETKGEQTAPRADCMRYWADQAGVAIRPGFFDSGDGEPGAIGEAQLPVYP